MSGLRAGLRRAGLAVLLAGSAAAMDTVSLAAQGEVLVAGRVARLVRGDTVGVPGAMVTLHRVGRAQQGPLDSTRSDAAGRFRFRFPRDTTSLHLLSAKNAGIEYFSSPIAMNPARADTGVVLLVHDTSTSAPVQLDGRNIVLSRPGDDGARRVLELLVLRNAGDVARVAPDTVRPAWAMRLPAGVVGFDVGPGDISGEAVIARNDSLLVFAPLSPGDRQLVIEYAIPGDRDQLAFPFSVPVRGLNVLVEDSLAELAGLALPDVRTDTVQGKPYRRFSGSAAAGDTLRVRWPDPRTRTRQLLGALVGLVAAGVVFATIRALRRPGGSTTFSGAGAAPRGPGSQPADSTLGAAGGGAAGTGVPARAAGLAPAAVPPGELLDRIAALDAVHAGRQAELGVAAWAEYLAARERLVEEALRAAR